jgi:hypothetical protein
MQCPLLGPANFTELYTSNSARKRNKKAANAKLSKNRIYIGDEYDRWKEIKTALRLETNSGRGSGGGVMFGFFRTTRELEYSITEHAHNLYRMSSNLRSIAYDLHYCPDSKNYRRQNKMTFSPELYIVALKK